MGLTERRSPRSVRHGAGAAALSLLLAAPAPAAVDLTGTWLIGIGEATPATALLTQTGTLLQISLPASHLILSGPIDPDTGIFTVGISGGTITFCGGINGSAAADGSSFAGEALTAPLACGTPTTGCTCGTYTSAPAMGVRLVAPRCGDGVVTGGEQCDPGAPHPCCPDCRFAAAGTACASDGRPCTSDVCDGAGACMHGPYAGCVAADRGAFLALRDGGPADRRVAFKWAAGAGATSRAAFGDPTLATDVHLCVFDGGQLLAAVDAPAVGQCPAPPCWHAHGTGFRFASALAGRLRVSLRAEADGAARLAVRAARSALVGLSGSLQRPDALAQLVARDATGARCWQAPFGAPTVSSPDEFVARR